MLFNEHSRRNAVRSLTSALLLGAAFCAAPAVATTGTPIAYPSRGQTPDQQERDQYACYGWARQRSGFDPALTPASVTTASTTSQTRSSTSGGLALGALKGATAARLMNGSANRGALLGGLGAGIRKRNAAAVQAESSSASQQDAVSQQARDHYARAYAACMSGRGYAVR